MKRMAALFLTLILLLGCVGAVADTWYCPECGTKCDGNFCPQCGTRKPDNVGTGTAPAPAPAAPAASGLQIERAELNTDGSFTISWTGGKAPYKLNYTWYVNGNHNRGSDVTLWNAVENYYSTTVDLKEDLVPGEHYWLILSDAEGNQTWYDYATPRRVFTEFSGTRLTVSLRTRKNNRSSTVTSFSANEMNRNYMSQLFGATIKMTVGRHASDFLFTARMVLFLPNGEPLLFSVLEDCRIPRSWDNAYWETVDFRDAWVWLVNNKDGIPAGRYTYRLYVNDCIFGEHTFSIN